MIFGTTYSHRHAAYLKLNPSEAFESVCGMGFSSIRIACYWNEIEKKKGEYDFTAIKSLLNIAKKHSQQVVVTIGMKAPRYPEYYFPEWLEEKNPVYAEPYLIPFIYKSLEELRGYELITHWQVENEPLDPSGPKNLIIPVDLLQKEIDIFREKDNRPLIVNVWGNELKKRQLLPQIKNRVDVIGLDMYYKVPVFGPVYRGPQDSSSEIRRYVHQMKKPLYIMELQAEPWERNLLLSRSDKTPSMNPEILLQNIKRVMEIKPEAVYLWGSEYWLWKKKKGDSRFEQAVIELMKSY